MAQTAVETSWIWPLLPLFCARVGCRRMLGETGRAGRPSRAGPGGTAQPWTLP